MRPFLRTLISFLVIVLIAARAFAADAPRPNIVFILTDDMGWADVSYHGGEIKTPNIDALSRAGTRLEQFYVQPVCSPTRASFMTGRYPMRYGLQVGVIRPWASYGLPLEERTLAAALQQSGYETAICGKWHLGLFQHAYLPTQRGFDHQYGNYNGAIDYFTHIRDDGFDWHRDDKACHDEGYSTFLDAQEAARLIKSRDQSKPMFLYVAFNAVHSPHMVPEKYKEPYKSLPEPRQTYAGMCAAMDEAVGTVVAALDEAKMRDNTLIVWTNDNGGPAPGKVTSNGPLRAGKGTVYEGGTRVSCCAVWPGHLKAGAVVNEPMHMVDWYPTLLGLAGVSVELDVQKLPLDGKDAWPMIADGKPSPHDAILLNASPFAGAIRMGDWKLVVNGQHQDSDEGGPGDSASQPVKTSRTGKKELNGQNDKVELFNIKEDPNEKHNLAQDNPDKVKEMRARYEEYATAAVPPKAKPKPKGFVSPKVWGESE